MSLLDYHGSYGRSTLSSRLWLVRTRNKTLWSSHARPSIIVPAIFYESVRGHEGESSLSRSIELGLLGYSGLFGC